MAPTVLTCTLVLVGPPILGPSWARALIALPCAWVCLDPDGPTYSRARTGLCRNGSPVLEWAQVLINLLLRFQRAQAPVASHVLRWAQDLMGRPILRQ